MKKFNRVKGLRARTPLAMAVAFALLSAPAAQAFTFGGDGDFTGSLDTTVSLGVAVRVEGIDSDLIGKANFNPLIGGANQRIAAPFNGLGSFPGSQAQVDAIGRFSVNRDDGDLNYAQGAPISQLFKITSELELNYKNYGAFIRASYFYDFENVDRATLSQAAKDRVGKDFDLLDAFVFGTFDVGGHNLTVKAGQQVISWGESTFIQGGINVINPIDVSKLRVPGAELKEALIPVQQIWGSFGITDNLSVEGFYQFDFKHVEADPAGTYFSQNDFATDGGTYVMLGFGIAPQPVVNQDLFAATCGVGGSVTNSDRYADLVAAYSGGPGGAAVGVATATGILNSACNNAVPRTADVDAKDSGQFGFAAHYFAESWNQTDFGFYAVNYHSRLPLLSGKAVNVGGFLAGGGVSAAKNASFYVEYPEDIQLYGISFNTTLPGGVAWQGELSYRPNVPLQVDDVELLFAALTPLNSLFGNPLFFGTPGNSPRSFFFTSQLGQFSSGENVQGWREKDQSHFQMTFTKAFPQSLGADQIALVGEVGATQVWNMEDPSVLRYEGEGTDTGGGPSLDANLLALIIAYNAAPVPGSPQFNALFAALNDPANAGALRNPYTTNDGFPTPFSWGYRLAARADYNTFMDTPITLSPRIAFSQDVSGITPGPGGNFLEGRKSFLIGVEANYLNTVIFDLNYTRFFGALGLNQIGDRDFAAFSVKYSF